METLIDIPTTMLRPNPRQPRQVFAEADLQTLAESISEHGLIQPLVATPAADGDGYWLVVGERRWRAAQLAGLEVVPALVRPQVDERALLELALVENVQRQDLSAAEEARAYQQLADLGLSDEEIGRRVGKARTTVANLRGLARLPAEVLERVGPGEGQIPQTAARALVQLAPHVERNALQEAMKELARPAADEPDAWRLDPDEVIANLAAEVGVPLPNVNYGWDLAWPKKSITARDTEGALDIPACSGCPNYVRAAHACLLPRCLALKTQVWREHELKRVAKKTGVPVAGADEIVTVIDVDWENRDRLRRWLEKPASHLRLVPAGESHHSYYHRELLGSPAVTLATTDPGVLKRDEKKKVVVPEGAPREAVAEAEEKQRAARRAERSRERRAMHDVDWLGVHTAEVCADQVQAQGATLAWLLEYVSETSQGGWPPLTEALHANEKARASAKGKDLERLRREAILLWLLEADVPERYAQPADRWRSDWPRAQTLVERLIVETMGFKLPKGWNQPPVHRTDHNCHVCGRFTPNDHVTKRDVEEDGWDVRYQDEEHKRLAVVTCSDACRAKLPKLFPERAGRARKRQGTG